MDLTAILRDWPYESGEVRVRIIRADDGRLVLQMRVDLGVLQMELVGRPDGATFDNAAATYLAVCRARLEEHVRQHGSEEGFEIASDDVRQLRDEAAQFYHRYVSLFVLDYYDAVVADANHTLDLIDFCARFAPSPEERFLLEPRRPGTIMMRTRAEASKAVAEHDTRLALSILDTGIAAIRAVYAAHREAGDPFESVDDDQGGAVFMDDDTNADSGAPPSPGDDDEDEPSDSIASSEPASSDEGSDDQSDDPIEVQFLLALREQLVPKLPVSQRTELLQRLNAAVAAQNYELAAILRDELRLLKD